jgi:hypothetical protein
MSTHRESTKLIGTVAVGLIVYALSNIQCASQTPDSVAIPKAGLEKLESAVSSVAEALRAIRPAPTSTQTAQSTSSPPSNADQLALDPDTTATTSQVFLEGRWITEWPRETVTIELGRVEDRRYHDGKLRPESDGTYTLTDDHYGPCYYNIAVSPDHNKMFWVPVAKEILPKAVVSVTSCRPATIFVRIRDCCGEQNRDRDCCGERHRDVDCCSERHRDRDCCGERHRDRECCGERHRDRDCCGERHRDRECCFERGAARTSHIAVAPAVPSIPPVPLTAVITRRADLF